MIRPPSAQEVPALRRIERAAGAAFAGVGLPEVAADEPPPLVHLEAFRVAGRAWVATDDRDRPVAYLVALVLDGRAHVEQVSVDPAHRGRGLGAALLDHLGRWARERDHAELSLTAFRDVPWNAPYYARLGFEVLADPGPELRAVMAAERRALPARAPRVAMVRPAQRTPGASQSSSSPSRQRPSGSRQ